MSITAEHEETLQPITNTEPVDNEFFFQDGAVYFSGLYENGLLKGVAPKDFCCWHYWGKSSTACFLGGIRLRGADPASFRVLNYAYAMDKTAVYTTSGRIPDAELAAFQVLDKGQNDSGAPQGYAKDSRQVYFHNGDGKVKIIKGAEVSSFRSLGDTYFARDEKRIYAYREIPDGNWDSGWRFTAGDESDEYMDDPNNAGIYKLNTICNDDPDIISLLNTPAPCAFERDENGVFQQIKDWKPDEDEEDPDMDILKQCQKWHEESKQHKIIDALEAIPAEERTPEMDSELARAYNNLADPHKPTCKEMLKKALALLKPHEEYFEDDYYWNFRMGYSYFYLDQEGRALRYFEKALEVRPGDDDTKEFIDRCKQGISLPQFWECFRDRTENWWETFAEMEAELRQMMDDDKDHTRGAELVAQMEETLNLAFDEISFELGVGGEKHELILTPEGNKVKLFELVYFQKHAPKEVLEHWNILVGRQPVQNIGLRTNDGWEISGDDVQIWLEEQGENSFAISAYCEKLLPKLQEEEGRAWWMLTMMIHTSQPKLK